MPFGGNDWLALTQEPTLEPDLPICDPHHHFWDYRLERIPYQRYLMHELADDINSGHNVRSTVFRGPVHVPRRRPGRDASGG
jgi:predicted TIM-barrel fold metal-dependent hydrolase